MEMYLAADRGQLTQAEATLMVGILLSAAADTTVMTMANAIRAFCEFPDQYQLLRSEPALVEPRSTRACAGIRLRAWPGASP